jgi:hypothetical protein
VTLLLLVTAAALLTPQSAEAQDAKSVLIAFHPGGGDPRPGYIKPTTVFSRLSDRTELSLGLLGATQGAYSRRQTLLDMSAGTRVSRSGYKPPEIPKLRLFDDYFEAWDDVVRRASSAPTEIVPGLLADSVPGGAAYVNVQRDDLHGDIACIRVVERRGRLDGIVAADRKGRVADVPAVCVSRARRQIQEAARVHRLIVVTLPEGHRGDELMDALIARRPASQLLIIVSQPPRSRAPQMLPIGIAGLRDMPGLLTSRTTRRAGLVTATDVLPTALAWLGRPIPGPVQGRAITATGERDVAALRRLERRLRVVYPRRFPALTYAALGLLAAFVLLTAARRRKLAMRVTGLAMLWIPSVSLLTAALAQDRTDELLTMAAAPIALAILTDRFVRWPRAPAVPALTAIVAYCIDLAAGSDLIVRSLLGPNPRFGSRFFGIGNELEAILPPLLLVGLAALVVREPRGRRLALLLGLPMLALAAIVGSGRLGADVGGVITIVAAAAGAVLLAIPRIGKRAIALAVAAPVIGLGALIVLDVVTGGDAHLSRTVLGADGFGDVWDTIARRYQLAWNSLQRGLMPLATLLAVALAVWGIRRRHDIAVNPAYAAALGGGLAGGVAGALSNDSGPVLLVLGVVVLGCTVLYIRGRPAH